MRGRSRLGIETLGRAEHCKLDNNCNPTSPQPSWPSARATFVDAFPSSNHRGAAVTKRLLCAAAAVVLAGALSNPAIAKVHHRHHHYRPTPHYREAMLPPPPPITTIHFHGGAVGFIVGVGGASGFIDFHGERYPIEVSGLKVGTIGVSSYEVDGRVFNLRHLSDIEGTYSAGEASATAGGGAGDIDMTNDRGVEIRASSTSAGLQLTLGGGGVTITLKH